MLSSFYLFRLVLHHRPFSGIHRKFSKGCLDFINAILWWYQLCRHSHKADAAILLLDIVLSKRSSYDDVVLVVLNHTIHCAGWSLLHLLGECKSKKIISIRQISKLVLYEIPFSMYQMTKRVCHKSMTRPHFSCQHHSFFNHSIIIFLLMI